LRTTFALRTVFRAAFFLVADFLILVPLLLRSVVRRAFFFAAMETP
jgi:hypothetical protein